MDKLLKEIYELGRKANYGDETSLVMLIDKKRKLIEKQSYGDEDCYQYIIELLIKGIKKYKF